MSKQTSACRSARTKKLTGAGRDLDRDTGKMGMSAWRLNYVHAIAAAVAHVVSRLVKRRGPVDKLIQSCAAQICG